MNAVPSGSVADRAESALAVAPAFPIRCWRAEGKPGRNRRVKTHVEFRSAKFPPYEGEEDEINPGLWGKRLTEYLAAKLAERSIATEEMAVEDWGCYLPVKNEGFRLALCCGHQDGDDDEFSVFTDPATPKVKKWFRTLDATPQLARLVAELREILEADEDIREVVWYEPHPK